jgi:hypothetical protein
MDDLVKFVRNHRPSEDDPLLFDRKIRLLLNWLDTHKIRERAVFEAQEGKEYAAMVEFVEERTGVTPLQIDTELFQLLLGVSRGVSSAAAAAGGKRRSTITRKYS